MFALVQQTSATAIEIIGNRILELDGEADRLLAPLNNKTVQICIDDLAIEYFFVIHAGSLVVKPESSREPSVKISGKLAAFIAAAANENSGDAIFTGDLQFQGEINTARQFQKIAQSLNIDWQELLSRPFGDVKGELLAKGIKGVGMFAKNLLHNFKQDFPEYIQEEARLSPTSVELNMFAEDVDILRSQSDRLQARVNRLQAND